MCSRVLYRGAGGLVVTARTWDWYTPSSTELWVTPEGAERSGCSSDHPFAWVSTRSSVVAQAFHGATVEGLNTSGLGVNMLYLAESVYPERDSATPGMCISALAQWALDSFDTVAELASALQSEPFQVTNAVIPGGQSATAHLAASDASGDSAIFELLDGELVAHHGAEYCVMTNDPSFEKQLALCAYFEEIGTEQFLPGTERPADRFVRTKHYLDACPETDDGEQGAAYAFAIMRNVSVPFQQATAAQPNVAPTIWRSAFDHRALRYYFESTVLPNVFWVDLANLDLAAGAPMMRLVAEDGPVRAGEVSASFEPAEPMQFIPEGNPVPQ